MAEFRNPRNNWKSLPPSFGGEVKVEGSSGSGKLSAEVSGRTTQGVTGKASLNASVKRKESGTGGGGSLGLGVGYEDKKYKLEAQGDIGGSFFLPSEDLKKFGVKNASNISDAQLRQLSASIKDVTGLGAQDELSLSVTPKDNFKEGVDGAMIRYKIKF
jgi:hypothetical protein